MEDDPHIAELLVYLLEREGYEVQLASDGREASAVMGTMPPPNMALFDVMLPYKNGIELLQQARANPEWLNTSVLMLTAKSQEKDIVQALDAGANDYIVKPFNPGELMARLRRYLK